METPTSILCRYQVAAAMLFGATLVVAAVGCQPPGTRCESDADCFAGEDCRPRDGVRVCVPERETRDPADTSSDSDSNAVDAPDLSDSGMSVEDTVSDTKDEEVSPESCPKQRGVCAGATTEDGSTCDADDYGPDYQTDETRADDLDNDCDGTTDEVFSEVWGYWRTYCARMVDDRALCWGGPIDPSPPEPVAPDTFAELSTGKFAACGISQAGEVTCWGRNSNGQLDSKSGPFRSIAAGTSAVCGIDDSDAELTCWGDDSDQLVSGAPTGPTVDVALGWKHGCAVEEGSRTATCWGTNSLSPPPDAFEQIASGQLHVCGITTGGALRCWGDDREGESSPPGGSDYVDVAAGFATSCALDDDGSVECWGKIQENAPQGSFQSVAAADESACAVRSDGRIDCWGANEAGETDPP